ncbi:DUF4350 domain-containing protein [Bacillus sinesaloumensis]|uniref:DUF4350 domain-containing protein n=1 Tax=Litchfieldia sinesaloumensis TaxID=1926280 RepID=UPI0009885676|nr:DUF4350 domain-containing protein [Bacillus sinesaloumensis]
MRKPKVWMILIGLITLLLFLTYFIESHNPKVYPRYVSESPAPTGVKALYTYLNDENKAKRWSHSPNLLTNKEDNQVLIMVEPYFTPEQEEARGYLDFIQAGNKLILFKENPRGMFEAKTLPAYTEPFIEETTSLKDNQGTVYDANVQTPNRIIPTENETILLEDDAGVIATSRKIGEGELIIALTPEWLTNHNLLNYDHLSLVLSLITNNEASIYYFDEYVHSTKNASGFTTLYPSWFLLLLLQSGLLVLLWLWYKGKRFGPVSVLREETVRFSDEGIRALSAWYIKGRYYHESLNIQADFVKQVIQEKWGTPSHKDWTVLSKKLAGRWSGQRDDDIKRYLRNLTNALQNEQISKRDYLQWSKNLDELRKEVEKG